MPLSFGFYKGKCKGKQKSAFEIQNILNIKSGKNKKKPLDSEAIADEGFDNIITHKSG